MSRRHIVSAHATEHDHLQYVCQRCRRHLTLPGDLDRLCKWKIHPKSGVPKHPSFSCKPCNRAFANLASLKKHLQDKKHSSGEAVHLDNADAQVVPGSAYDPRKSPVHTAGVRRRRVRPLGIFDVEVGLGLIRNPLLHVTDCFRGLGRAVVGRLNFRRASQPRQRQSVADRHPGLPHDQLLELILRDVLFVPENAERPPLPAPLGFNEAQGNQVCL